jgi:Notch-like protein
LCREGITGERCDVRDVCASGPCLNNGKCKTMGSNPGGYICECNELFTGNHCEYDINECETESTCTKDKICRNEHGGYHCDGKINFVMHLNKHFNISLLNVR